MSNQSGAVIRCRGLVKQFPQGVLAVDGLDLEVMRGECFGLLGPNGAGKTTTVEMLEGLTSPTAGMIEILGKDWATAADSLRQDIGITLQETHLPDRLTVTEIILLFRSFYKHGRDLDQIMSLVSLEEKRFTWYEKLSGGQKQRLAVACALVSDPQLLFLDEPTTGLDPQSRRQLWDVVLGAKQEGKTILLTTHYMDEAERLCDRVAIVDSGKVIAQGTPRELIIKNVGHEVLEFVAIPDVLTETDLADLSGVRAVRRVSSGWALTVDQVHLVIQSLLAIIKNRSLSLQNLSTHSATLEDVFIILTGRKLRD